MQFTFGITTTKEPQRMSRNTNNHIREMIEAIRENKIPDDSYEIIIVGGDDEYQNDNDVTHFEFDDINPRPGWFTRKKNMITENAKFNNIVFSHDYIRLDKDWYNGFLKFGDDWDICMCIHKTIEGHRFRDWLAWDDPDLCYNVDGFDHRIALVPYDYTKTQHMQISGFWWVAKKTVMQQDPLDEKLAWGDAEDVEWSMRVRDKYKYVMNTNSVVEVLRTNKRLSSYYVEGDAKYYNTNWLDKWKL